MKKLQLLSTTVLGVCAVSAFATPPTTFQVTASVGNTCVLSAPDLSFGVYDPVDSSDTNGSTTLSASCTNGSAYNLGLDAGLWAGTPGDVTTRNMKGGSTGDFLSYNLYQDSFYSQEWGDTVGVDTVADSGTGLEINYTIYGQIAGGQTTVADDSYSDTITVSVTF